MVSVAPFTLYLPIVLGGDSLPRYGAQVDGALTIPLTANRIYHSAARWSGIDSWFDANLQAFRTAECCAVIIGTRTCPVDYRLWPELQGSPPREACYPDYADWIFGLAAQYLPWGMEVWNEPDVPKDIPNDLQFWLGAWVDGNNYYRAGRHYGELLSAVYPWLHSLEVKVIGGALVGTAPNDLEFLSGMLETGKCDFVSWHCYLYETDDFEEVYNRSEKIHRITHLPQIISETAVLSWKEGAAYDTPSLRQRQADYVEWLRRESRLLDFPLWLWYSSDNTWRNCGLRRWGEFTPAYEVWGKEG